MAAFLSMAVFMGMAVAQEPLTDSPLPPEQAAATMIVPEGFQVTLFAAEPDVRQPIGFCIDDRGRLWVAEAYNYPVHGNTPGDRIIILEDRNGDGRHEHRTVFCEGLNYVTGIEVGFGGAWVMSPPNFYFIPDRDGDDVPDTLPVVLLDGFGNHANAHNLANGFAWGPDGWLYGTHGRTNWSTPGKPGTPAEDRIVFDGGVWRYHPIRHVWEPYADGTTNPWGIDWNDYGDAFVCNCVNPHLFQVIQGAHYEPWRNRKSSEFAFERIPTIADHLHFTGGQEVRGGLGSEAEDAAGGGHAHCGTMIYLGDNWPDRYRNTIFMNNIHGRRINNDILQRNGSGYKASHGSDLLRSRDPWFMGVTLQYGPDGAVYVIDWSDTGECHSIRNTQRQTGRIYKIRYTEPTTKHREFPKLSDLTDAQLVDLQLQRNDWWVRHARRILQERYASGILNPHVITQLKQMFSEQTDVTRQLRALWSLHVIAGDDTAFLLPLLKHSNEYIQAWAIRFLCEGKSPPQQALQIFADLATDDADPSVRLELASALQRLPLNERWKIAEFLTQHKEDVGDPNIPLMLWYGIEPLVHEDPVRFVNLALSAEIPLIRRHIARRAAQPDIPSSAMSPLMQILGSRTEDDFRSDLLQGLLTGLEGNTTVAKPKGWSEVWELLHNHPNEHLCSLATRLALIFNDEVAIATLMRRSVEADAMASQRLLAIEALSARRVPDFGPVLLTLISDPVTQSAALRGLARYDEPETASVLLAAYPSLSSESRQDVIQTLATRVSWTKRLLSALKSGLVARTDITAYSARQIASLGNRDILEQLVDLWGDVRETSADRRKLIVNYRKKLSPEVLSEASLSNGRAVFRKHCANCHRFFGDGGKIGPDLTGSQRTNIDYMLENLIDPSAAVARDYQMEIISTRDGRVLTGLIESDNSTAVVILTVNERIVIPADEIDERRASTVSMMPEGLLKPLSDSEIRDLMGWLAGPGRITESE